MSEAKLDPNEFPKVIGRYNILRQLGGDLVAAALSATLIAPTVAIIDRAVVGKTAYGQPILQGLRTYSLDAIRRPGKFVFGRSFGIVWVLYGATYAVANGSETLANTFHEAAAGTLTFVSTMIVNVPLGVWKDLRFAQMYGANETPALTTRKTPPIRAKVSKAAAGTFLVRDGVTIFSSFVMAPSMAAAIPDSVVSNAHSKYMIAQIAVPILSQLLATPFHLLGLDFHNRQRRIAMMHRLGHIRPSIPATTVLRCIRIIPAFGVGCLVNQEARTALHGLV